MADINTSCFISSAIFYLTLDNTANLFCIVLYCSVLHCSVLNCSVLYCGVLNCSLLYCIVLYCSVLYYSVLYYSVLYYSVLNYSVLYTCRLLYCSLLQRIALCCRTALYRVSCQYNYLHIFVSVFSLRAAECDLDSPLFDRPIYINQIMEGGAGLDAGCGCGVCEQGWVVMCVCA